MKDRKHKILLAVTVLYWMAIFTATHIHVPGWTRKMGVSDKIMHFSAYMILAFLIQLSISFENKVNWKKTGAYIICFAIGIYGIIDELLQILIAGRNFDIQDYMANILGGGTAMIICTLLAGKHAVMIPVTAPVIFIPSLVRSGLIPTGTAAELICYAAAMTFITISWLVYLKKVWHIKNPLLYIIPPAAVIAILKVYSLQSGKPFGRDEIVVSAIAAAICIIASAAIGRELSQRDNIKRVADKY